MQRQNDTPTPGQNIPEPDNFPVNWQSPEDAKLLWQMDPLHYPDPMMPLEFDLMTEIYARGMKVALEMYDLPVQLKSQRINTYLYGSFTPQGVPPDFVVRLSNQLKRIVPGLVNAIEQKAIDSMTRRYMTKMQPIIDNLAHLWEGEYLPEIKQYLAEWEAYDLTQSTDIDLATHLEITLAHAKRAGDIHFLIAFPYLVALSQFDELYVELFGAVAPFDSYRLLQGFDNKILEGGRALWQLSRKAQTMPEVQQVLENESAANVIGRLNNTVTGQIFLPEFRAFLAEYGQRGDKFSTIADVSWLEEPTPAIKNLQDYIQQPDRDMAAELAAEAEEREQVLATIRQKLSSHPPEVVERFEAALQSAQEAIVIHADHGFWIDYAVLYQVRRVMLELGQRLARQGMIDTRDDLFYLTLAELEAAIAGLSAGEALPKKQAEVLERKAEVCHFRAIQPPLRLGRIPLLPRPDEPFTRMLTKFEGATPNAAETNHQLLQGNGGSPGVARGPAKVVRSIYEAGKLQPGDILVAETTAAPWTPLFATAAAVVTDTGGILSHCAVVAREYRIPAVVGVRTATQTIQDGDIVEVDGSLGTARIITHHQ